MDQSETVRQFDKDYEQMLSDMFDWPWPDHEPEDYTPLPTIKPEIDHIPSRSPNLMIMTHGSAAGPIAIIDMEDSHLQNCISYFKRTCYRNNQHKLQLMLEEMGIRKLEEQRDGPK